MFAVLRRVLLIVIILCIFIGAGYAARQLMIAWLKDHSFSHYFVRIVLVIACFLLAKGVMELLTAHNPEDTGFLAGSKIKVFKISNVVKRLIDLFVAVVLVVCFLPVFLFVAIAVYLIEGYPVFYVSKRYVSVDQSITIFKFRTMVKDAVSDRYRLKERFMRDGYLDIPIDCEVYTPIGRLLERFQIVELLQLLNVLFNNMSLIGNRPLPKDNIILLSQFDGWANRFASPAGLSGISQVVGKLNQNPRDRLELECAYSELYCSRNANILKCDFLIVIYTIRFLVFGKPLAIEDARKMLNLVSDRRS